MPPNLLKDPIPDLFKAIAVPASVGYFFNTMYNVVDTYYAGQLSVDAIAALSISFPVFFLIIALGAGISQGTTAILSNVMGEEDSGESVRYAHQAVVFGLGMSAVLTVLGLLASPSLFRLLGAEEEYLETALAYMNVIMSGTTFFMLNFILNGILSAQGDTRSHRNMLVLGFLLNLALNPLFMFGFAFIPALGIAGIAWATVLIQVLTTIYLAYKVWQSGQLQFRSLKLYMPDWKALNAVFQQGYPASLNMFTVALGMFIITFYLSEYGKKAVAAYGVAIRAEQIFLLPTIGLNIATLSLAGQNNGAKNYDRVREVYRYALRYAFFIAIIGGLGLILLRDFSLRVFTDDEQVIEIGSSYLLIASFLIWFYAALFITVSLLQGLKKPIYALWVGLSRQIVFPILFFSLGTFVLKLEVWNIWASIALITSLAAVIMIFIGRAHLRRLEEPVQGSQGKPVSE